MGSVKYSCLSYFVKESTAKAQGWKMHVTHLQKGKLWVLMCWGEPKEVLRSVQDLSKLEKFAQMMKLGKFADMQWN